jgi:hypothetical protein
MNRATALTILISVVLAACGADAGPDLGGQQAQLEQQLSGVKRAQTATAAALARAATAEAKATRQAIDEANARATAESRKTAQAQGAASATVQAYAFNLTATADALAIAQQQARATATADADQIAAAQSHQAATATAAAIDHVRVQADQDAQQARQVSAIIAWIAPAGVLLAILAIVALLYRLASQWVDAHRERWRLDNQRVALMGMLIETRTGTVVFVGDPRVGYTPQLMAPPTFDHFDASQLQAARPIETFRLNTPQGAEDIPKHEPADDQLEANRKLAMRLLRDAMKHTGPQANRLPGYRDLNWPSETWTRAVKLLKPHVTTKPGRGGGTVLASEWSTLQQLYVAVGERRTPLPGNRQAPSP